MKRIFRLYFQSISVRIYLIFILVFSAIGLILGLALQITEDFDVQSYMTTNLSAYFWIILFVFGSTTNLSTQEGTLILAGVKKNDYVNFRYLYSLLKHLVFLIILLSMTVKVLSFVYLQTAILLLGFFLKENLMLPFKLSAKKSIHGILPHIISGSLVVILYVLFVSDLYYIIPTQSLQITAIILGIVFILSTPFSISLAKKLYAKKDI